MKIFSRSNLAAALAVSAFAVAGVASAAQPARGGMYQQELAVCGHNQQDRAACIREAGAARQAAAHGQLTNAPDYMQNAMARCQRQDASGRAACEARVRGNGRTEVEGSVMGGGLIYETVTPISMPSR
jgi:hypothetical protein